MKQEYFRYGQEEIEYLKSRDKAPGKILKRD